MWQFATFRKHFVGPFVITPHIGNETYQLSLASRFSYVHPIFHVNLFGWFTPGRDGVAPLKPIEVDNTWEYLVEHLL